MYYKLQITHEGSNLIYPVPDISKIRNPKYRKDMKECACYYPESITGQGITELTDLQHEVYGKCRVVADKTAIQGNGEDVVTFTVNLPAAIESEQAILYVDGALTDFQLTDTNQAIFQMAADASMIGDILGIVVESTNWHKSDRCLLEVI